MNTLQTINKQSQITYKKFRFIQYNNNCWIINNINMSKQNNKYKYKMKEYKLNKIMMISTKINILFTKNLKINLKKL